MGGVKAGIAVWQTHTGVKAGVADVLSLAHLKQGVGVATSMSNTTLPTLCLALGLFCPRAWADTLWGVRTHPGGEGFL